MSERSEFSGRASASESPGDGVRGRSPREVMSERGALAVPIDRAIDLITFGEAMVLLRAGDGAPLATATTFRRDVAGAEGNVAVGVARLGHRVVLAIRIGDDAFGDSVVAAYRAEGIEVVVVRDPDRPTGLMVRDVHEERPIDVAYYRAGSAASALNAEDLPLDRIADSRVLHVTGITTVLSEAAAQATAAAVGVARQNGTLVTFDPNLRRRLATVATSVSRWQPIIEQSGVVLASLDEAVAIAGSGERPAIAGWFHECGVRVVVVKDGAAGAWASDGGDIVETPAWPVRAVDPVGAGDAFAAGFIAAVLDGAELPQALRSAAAVAACAVQVAGDTTGLPTARARDAMLADDPRGDVRR